jgi:predicted Zn-dependent protease
MSRDRVNAYEEGAKDSAYLKAADPQSLVFRHKMVQAKIYGFLDRPNVTLRRMHNNDSAPGRYARTVALYRQGRRDEAIALLDSLIIEMPDNPWLYELKGQIYYETGLAASGIAPYQKALSLKPDEPLLLIGLASCQLGVGQAGLKADRPVNKQAINNLRRALRIDPQDATAYFQMSKAYGQLGETALAQWALAEYYAGHGSPEAKMHATRAMKGLPKDSVEYIRAIDILSAPDPSGRP